MIARDAADVSDRPKPTYVMVLPWDPSSPGGVNEVVLNLYREMLAGGEFQPLILVRKWSAARPVETLRDGRRVVFLRIWAPSSVLSLMKWLVASPVFLTDLVRFCRRHRVAAFNFHYASPNALPIAAMRALGLFRGALIISFHGADLTAARKSGRIHRALWGAVFRSATAITACSRAFAAEVAEFAGDARGRVHAIQNGLDIEHFRHDIDRAEGLPHLLRDREFVLSVATFEHKKGLDVLLRAFPDVRRARPGLALAIVGMPAGAEGELRALARQLGVADDVVLVEGVPHSRIGLFLERATAFCLPSRSEPFGIAILEAGAYGLPVVASRVGGIVEIIVDGESGILVPPDDPGALALALVRVLSDGPLAKRLGEALHLRVATHFSWKRAYDQYRALLHEPNRPPGA